MRMSSKRLFVEAMLNVFHCEKQVLNSMLFVKISHYYT